jgi:YggT family protein
MVDFVIILIRLVSRSLVIIVIINTLLSYFMSPFHPLRTFLGKIVDPLLVPIRKIIPPLNMIDFSPLILIILLQVIENLLVTVLSRI